MSRQEIIGLDPRSRRTIRVTTDHGMIARIEEANEDTDLYLSAGFVDLQVNGYAGFDLNADHISIETVTGLVNAMLAQGVTCFAPTLISAPEEQLCRALKVIAEARRRDPKVAACVPLVHMEGPAISPLDGYRGAHPADAIRPPTLAEFARWQDASAGLVGIVTLSPHFDESVEYIAALVQRGVHISIGHTNASPEQISAAVDRGASLSTHLANGIALEIPRHRNPIWRQLADDRLSASFIADGHHLPWDVLKVMLTAKGVERSVLVSDSVALAGLPVGVYNTPVGGQVELRPNGKLCVYGSEILAGSTAPLSQCIGCAVQMTALPLHDALAMATVNPGRFVAGRGRMALGARADLVRFRWNEAVAINDVWLAGEPIITNQG
jgi:N-acetylglucosamine-6-phosphate deacetylase